MALSIARLRVWLVVGAALLVLVIAGFLGYARYKTHRFLAGLPGKLGIDIRRETDGYTVSKSVGPNTTMTLHAAKAVEHKDGKLTLHDVSMVLYGRKQDRADRISGAEFEYDQPSGVVRAMGEVHIDLQAPTHGQPTGTAPTEAPEGAEDKRIVHIKTSGLVFLQKLGVAATDQELEFRFGEITGHAHGAEYNSDTGMVILQSAVEAHGEEHGAPVTLTATHAELDRPKFLATATDAHYTSPTQTARGDRAIVHLRADNSPERMEADGNVVLTGAAGGSVTTPHADLLLTPKGQAESAHLFGGVAYRENASLREVNSSSDEARVAFDPEGKAHTVLMTGKARIDERLRSAANAAWTEREATAARMNFALDGGVLRTADAAEAARLTLHDASEASELTGDTLHGNFTGNGKMAQLTNLRAIGHTGLHRLLSDDAEQTSTGDTLSILMQPATAAKTSPEQTIRQATQTGHVVLTSKPAPKLGTATNTTRATAEIAVYEGASDHVTLTGSVASGEATIVDETGRISAARIVLERTSGDATADGAIKATYLQPGAPDAPAKEPVHVIADRAELQHAAQRAIFHGLTRPARLWQGGSQIEAPVIELDQKQHSLSAHGERPDSKVTPVHSVLASSPSPNQTKQPQVVRVASRTLVYRDAERQAEFTGDVLVEDADGTARAAEATAFLQPAGTSKNIPASPGLALGGGVERIVAKGKVELDQPGRRATGEELVYTASDSLFVLTGTPAVRPRLMDETQGTVTGQSVSFHSGDKTVVVNGGAGERVQTITRVKQR